MRKKLLRSRSGFEKPESREEAIMQNILGASNVLEPSESNIEEILKSILYNTPYTKEAEFEIEKILLAIKNNGTYDGEVESRDMKILLAILRDSNYTEEPESRIEELFIEWLHQRSSVKVLEGVPPLTFTSLGLPLINYLIEGNTVQNGTPTPDSPVMPEGTGERTGNVMPAGEEKTVVSNGITFNSDGKGKYSISGTATAYASARFNLLSLFTTPISVSNGGQGTLSFFNTQANNNVTFVFYNGATRVDDWKQTPSNRASTAYNAIGNKYVDNIVITVVSGATVDITITPEFTNDGVLPSEFEPYGYKLPILSGGTTTPIYLGEVETERKIKKLVLTGEEAFFRDREREGSWRFYFDALISAKDNTAICSHFENIGSDGVNNSDNIGFCIFYKAQFGCRCPKSIAATVADFKSYLAAQYAAGTPVTVWYVLANEKTAVVNEPLMKIGDYADTLSMEQAGVEIPTVNGSNTLDVDTTVKPSNIYIKYK